MAFDLYIFPQGKSRQLIIRELQRTNLDVNMAVNNLLSRDDEAEMSGSSGGVGGGGNAEDWDDESDELISIFEHPDSHLLLDSEATLGDDLFEPSSPRLRGEMNSDNGVFYYPVFAIKFHHVLSFKIHRLL